MLWPGRQTGRTSGLWRRRRLRSGVSQPAAVKLVLMAIIDLSQFQALLVSEIRSHFPMGAHYDFMGAPGSISSHSFELHSRFIDDWRYFNELLRRQLELRTEPFLHSKAYESMMKLMEKMPVL
jgi:hypothetical protein